MGRPARRRAAAPRGRNSTGGPATSRSTTFLTPRDRPSLAPPRESCIVGVEVLRSRSATMLELALPTTNSRMRLVLPEIGRSRETV